MTASHPNPSTRQEKALHHAIAPLDHTLAILARDRGFASAFCSSPFDALGPTKACGCSISRRASSSRRRYGFDPTDEWLEHLQKSAVRFNSGGSGSFVSADGLVMTNHHVGADCLQKLSTADKDLIATGFHARTRDEEIKCVDLELNVLMDIEDVTERVNAAVKPGMDAAAAQQARRAVQQHDRKRIARQDRPAQRRGHALSGRPLPPLSLQEVHRRAAGLRAGKGHRLLRRRSRQLRVSRATTSTSASSASTRTASRSRREHYLTLEQGRRDRRGADLRGRASRAAPTG